MDTVAGVDPRAVEQPRVGLGVGQITLRARRPAELHAPLVTLGQLACAGIDDATAQPSAMTRLAPGPAAATQSMSCLGRRRLEKFTGTGLAQPNNAPPEDSSRISPGTSKVPTRST